MGTDGLTNIARLLGVDGLASVDSSASSSADNRQIEYIKSSATQQP
jgi:hypothetical protein